MNLGCMFMLTQREKEPGSSLPLQVSLLALFGGTYTERPFCTRAKSWLGVQGRPQTAELLSKTHPEQLSLASGVLLMQRALPLRHQAAGGFSSLDGVTVLKCPTTRGFEPGKLRAAPTQQDKAEHLTLGYNGPPGHNARSGWRHKAQAEPHHRARS